MDFYSFDTSAILNGRRDLLPASSFPSVWEKIEELVQVGSIASVDVVREELSRRDDDAHAWARANSALFTSLEPAVQEATKKVLAHHPKLLGKGGGRNGADPFVIGLAMTRNGVVVTEETASGNMNKPRIPDVCIAMGVDCVSLVGFIAMQQWRF